MNRFAKLFEVGGNGSQVLFFRELAENEDATVIHQIMAKDGIRMDFKVEFTGEKQEEAADLYLNAIDLEAAERLYAKFLEILEDFC